MTHPTPSHLVALAERLEAASGPDRQLDGLIALFTGRATVELSHPNAGGVQDDVPHYTASLDAALTLRTEWTSIETMQSAAGDFTRARVWDWRRSARAIDAENEWKVEGNRPVALNICAALLRARAAERQEG